MPEPEKGPAKVAEKTNQGHRQRPGVLVVQDDDSLCDGRYTISGYIAHGGTSQVFAAYDHEKRADCAIKIYYSSAMSDEELFRVADTEIRLMSGFRSPYLLKAYDHFEVETRVASGWKTRAMVMERCDFSLAEWGPKEQRTQADALQLFHDGMAGLDAYFHEHILHGDIKPDNVLLKGRSALLSDFSASLEVAYTLAQKTAMAQPDMWTAPEVRLSGQCTVYSDVYALTGTILAVVGGWPDRLRDDAISHGLALIDDSDLRTLFKRALSGTTVRSAENRPLPIEVYDAVTARLNGSRGAIRGRRAVGGWRNAQSALAAKAKKRAEARKERKKEQDELNAVAQANHELLLERLRSERAEQDENDRLATRAAEKAEAADRTERERLYRERVERDRIEAAAAAEEERKRAAEKADEQAASEADAAASLRRKKEEKARKKRARRIANDEARVRTRQTAAKWWKGISSACKSTISILYVPVFVILTAGAGYWFLADYAWRSANVVDLTRTIVIVCAGAAAIVVTMMWAAREARKRSPEGEAQKTQMGGVWYVTAILAIGAASFAIGGLRAPLVFASRGENPWHRMHSAQIPAPPSTRYTHNPANPTLAIGTYGVGNPSGQNEWMVRVNIRIRAGNSPVDLTGYNLYNRIGAWFKDDPNGRTHTAIAGSRELADGTWFIQPNTVGTPVYHSLSEYYLGSAGTCAPGVLQPHQAYPSDTGTCTLVFLFPRDTVNEATSTYLLNRKQVAIAVLNDSGKSVDSIYLPTKSGDNWAK